MKHFFKLLFALLALAPLSVFAQTGDFQTITAIPVFDAIEASGDGGNLAGFFNQLYILAVGACAIIAVAQIMIAGFRLATAGGSHSTIEEARDSIQNTVLGLLLVLSPTIVFGVINPDILNLRIDTGILDMASTSDATSPDVFSAEGTQNIAVSLRGNKWGALDNVCDFTGGTGAYVGFHIPKEVAVKKFGNNISVSQGRQCCSASSGELFQAASGQEFCNLNSVIENGRYIAHIEGRAVRLKTESNGAEVGEEVDFHFFTSGGGRTGVVGDSWFGDMDTIIIHSFRNRSSCESFLSNLTPESLTDIYKNRRAFEPLVGLLEGQYGKANLGFIPGSDELLPSQLISVESINRSKTRCDHVGFGVKN